MKKTFALVIFIMGIIGAIICYAQGKTDGLFISGVGLGYGLSALVSND